MTPTKRKSTICAQLEAVFGVPLGSALFYQFNYGLRFELGGEVFGNDEPIPRFLQAIERARTVARALFDEPRTLDAVLCYYPPTVNPGPALLKWKKQLQEIGFPFRLGKAERVVVVEDGDEPGDAYCQFWSRITLAPQRDPAMDVLLWAAVAQEMRVTPTINPGSFAQTSIYLVDFAARTILHVYDDRGMDVVALEARPLRPLYRRFNAWLLDCDRDRMDATFGKHAARKRR